MAAWGETPGAIRNSLKAPQNWRFDPKVPPTQNPGNGWIPDPVAIVRQNKWPTGMEHWGLPQRLGWLEAVMKPYTDRFYWARDRLAQAQGQLYEQFGSRSGGPF